MSKDRFDSDDPFDGAVTRVHARLGGALPRDVVAAVLVQEWSRARPHDMHPDTTEVEAAARLRLRRLCRA